MGIIANLSSQIGDKTEEGNRNVAQECIQNPSLLIEIEEHLSKKDVDLLVIVQRFSLK